MRHIIRAMDKPLNTRIKQRIAELGKTVKQTSIEATGGAETLRKILDGTTKSPRIDTIEKIAEALETTPEWLLGQGETQNQAERASDVRPASASLPSRRDMPDDVPVRGTAAGSHLRGAFQITGDAVDWVRRPPALMGARDIYALYVEGTSMEPQYFPGDLIYVHPNKPARIGDAIVVQASVNGDDETEATLGIFLKRTEQYVVIQKRNPDAQIQIKRETVKFIHKVLTVNELFGV